MFAKSPAVVKLFGEHSVVYGKLSVAATLSFYASSIIEASQSSGDFTINLPDLQLSYSLPSHKLSLLHSAYVARKSIDEYVADNHLLPKQILPYLTIASRLKVEFGINPQGLTVTVTSKIPAQSGLASSAACSTAFVTSLANYADLKIGASEIIEISRDGERVVHRNEAAGRIDVGTSYYGGYVTYSQADGIKKEDIETKLSLVLIDTGPKKSTGEMVNSVRKLYDRDKKYAEGIFEEMNEVSTQGLKLLKDENMEELGKSMLRNHELLKKLGVSTTRLDQAVLLAMRGGAYGAKLSGGGGGGMAIALANNSEKLARFMSGHGFSSYATEVSIHGGQEYLSDRWGIK